MHQFHEMTSVFICQCNKVLVYVMVGLTNDEHCLSVCRKTRKCFQI